MRRVFLVMSVRAWPYAQACIRTMLTNSTEPVKLHIICDDLDEQRVLAEDTKVFSSSGNALIEVIAQEDVADLIATRFPGLQGLQLLHDGHPCWRKVIDPIALSEPDEEVIVIDPDLFFPNRFSFEATPGTGVMMMRQGPNCLFPPEAVRTAFTAGVQLANHVDIGVAQMRAGLVDPQWLNDIVAKLNAQKFRDYMHIEAILWSAIAMRYGGHHLDPAVWRCWERGSIKRLAVALGMPGRWTLHLEPMHRLKCIHVSGPSKWWVKESLDKGIMKELGGAVTQGTQGPAYIELHAQAYEREQSIKKAVWSLLPGGQKKLT